MKGDYNNGKIYKIEPICEHEEGEIYIGSTTKQYLSQRMEKHRSSHKYWKEGKCNKVMVYNLFDKYGVENCNIILLENVNCNSKDELIARENHYIKTLKCVNKILVGRTTKEYYSDNKQEFLDRSKQYYDDNKEDKKEYAKQYRKENKQVISERRKDKIHCDICNLLIRKEGFKRHEESAKHQNNLTKQE